MLGHLRHPPKEKDPAAQMLRDPEKGEALFPATPVKEENQFWSHRPSVRELVHKYNGKVKGSRLRLEVVGENGKIREVPRPGWRIEWLDGRLRYYHVISENQAHFLRFGFLYDFTIPLPEEHKVGLASHNVASSPALPTTALHFLCTVDTAKIPLYLAAGPSLDVWTTEEATQAWFESILLAKPSFSDAQDHSTKDWWHLTQSQSPIGVLVQVENVEHSNQKPIVTELLFYGTIAASATAGLPTPPSSSPFVDNAQGKQLPELRVHALPLSSHLLHESSHSVPADADAQFLPPLLESHATLKSPKKQRDIFEEATIANKKARGRGGRAVSAAAARGNESQQPYNHRKSSLSIDFKTAPHPDSGPPSAHGTLSRSTSRPLSRSPSVTSDARPLSRKGLPEPQNRRSNLSQVATVPTQPEEPTTESRNKDALVKVVMAAMRMHGLQQRKQNKSRRASVAAGDEGNQQLDEQNAAEEAAKDEEYKLIYHQTYKGATLAMVSYTTHDVNNY
ncbi:conserved hypothetical protein [Pyrenophora tritici-repentis Pt-1C-BFP]|uniref:Sld7 C-terminal domain-containing protein n=1 Tax=Pyrenophora tritici-repentis (strain Pt-1C-BFP) TaxID=426418 RepID=B2W0Q2_PYRTR|nr:uncharacterized protein PTRG_04037 [Pyrenophora tritici-repentis Pt-1C-BFP]EDU46875.1 conserved hypothetical protein [Pyrenophora tritici-repentis Pt-1C-BFP]